MATLLVANGMTFLQAKKLRLLPGFHTVRMPRLMQAHVLYLYFIPDTGSNLKISVAPIPIKHLKAGHYRPASETPFQWRFAGGQMAALHCMLAWFFPKKHDQ